MLESLSMENLAMFTDALNAKPYSVVLYNQETGWDDETRTMMVDEAHGFCKIEYKKTTVHNSHGTDVDHELRCSENYTLEQMADILEKHYSPDAISKDHEGNQRYYRRNAYAYASKLRESGRIFTRIQSEGSLFLQKHFPNYVITKLRYASVSSAVFDAKNPSGEHIIIKLSRIPRMRKDAVDVLFNRIMQLGENSNLLPIHKKHWLPLDATNEVLAVFMPQLETFGIERKHVNARLSYTSFLQDKTKYGAFLEQKINLAVGLANALKMLHDNGLVHHDIKPENLFFEKTDHEMKWYLGDFNSIKPVEQQYEGKTSITLSYAAPEILNKESFSFSSDIYSWGRTLFFLLAGEIPKDNAPAHIAFNRNDINLYVDGRFLSCSANGSREAAFYKIINKAMAENPLERFQSGNELLEALENMDNVDNEEEKPESNPQSIPAVQENMMRKQAEPVSESSVKTEMHKHFPKAMERKISWDSGLLDEIELVYQKAAEHEQAVKILAELETGAMAEAKAQCAMVRIKGNPATAEQYQALPDKYKEKLMFKIGNLGLSSFSAPLTEPKIEVKLSPTIQQTRCCTAFVILNRLEKLDGAYNALHPKATLELQVPLGQKKGLVSIEILISLLYPWLSVREVTSNEICVHQTQNQSKGNVNPEKKISQNPDDAKKNERAALDVLKSCIRIFSESGQKNGIAFNLIITALSDVPLYLPVEIDAASILGGLDPAKLKKGDEIKLSKDVAVKVHTIKMHDGTEVVPLFTSEEEANKGPSVSTMHYYPSNYLPLLMKMGKTVVINPFGEHKFVLTFDMVKNILKPAIDNKVSKITPIPKPQPPTPDPVALPPKALQREFVQVLISCSSPPIGDAMQAAEYMIGKIRYFRENGLPEQDVQKLAMAICHHIPSYIESHFQVFMEAVNQDMTTIWLAAEQLLRANKVDQAYQISKPLADYLLENKDSLITGKYCFQNAEEEKIFCKVHNVSLADKERTAENYVRFLVIYAKLLQQLHSAKPAVADSSLPYLRLAKEMSDVNFSVYLYTARHYAKDAQLSKMNLDLALRYCNPSAGVDALAAIYADMGTYYLAHRKQKLGAACLVTAHRYASTYALRGTSKYLLQKTGRHAEMTVERATRILHRNHIQVGYTNWE